MRLAYSTNAFRRFTLEETLRMVAELGFDAVEIAADVPHLWPGNERSGRLEELRGLLDRLGLTVSNVNAFTMFYCGDMQHPSWIEEHEELRDMRLRHTLHALEVAAGLGAASVSTQPGGPLPEGLSRGRALARFVDGLRAAAPAAGRLGVKILVEPEPNLLIENSAQFLEFWDAAGDVRDVLGLNFDAGHFVCAGEAPCDALASLGRLVEHVHVEDIKGRRHHHLVPGEGEMDYEAFFAALAETGYDGYVSLELYTYQHDPAGAGARGLEVLRRYVG